MGRTPRFWPLCRIAPEWDKAGISFDKNKEKIGQTHKVLIDKKDGNYFVGRTEFDSPEVDNEVLIDARVDYATVGSFVYVRIDGAEDFDLFETVVR